VSAASAAPSFFGLVPREHWWVLVLVESMGALWGRLADGGGSLQGGGGAAATELVLLLVAAQELAVGGG